MKNQPEDIRFSTTDLNGIYRGVVESNQDDLQYGRVQVRIFGLHTDKITKDEFEGIPTDDLPWAEPILGLIEGSISGFGLWSVPLKGSHVMVFFENGNYSQPRYFGTVPGIPTEAPDTTVGFNDPDGTYPSTIGESDFHRLARESSDLDWMDTKESSRKKSVSKAGGGTWDEPATAYEAVYPDNIVLATREDLVVEMDSTPGKRRYHVFHPSNSYIEINEDGRIVVRNEKDKYELVMENKNIYIEIDENKTIEGNRTEKVTTNVTVDVGNDKTVTIGGDWAVTVTGDIDITATGDITLTGANIHLNP